MSKKMWQCGTVALCSWGAWAATAAEQQWQTVHVQAERQFNVACRYKATLFNGERVLHAVSVSAYYVDFELDGVRASVPAASADKLFVSDGKVINTVLYQRCDD